jgi:RNA polymerase primary sigma factor
MSAAAASDTLELGSWIGDGVRLWPADRAAAPAPRSAPREMARVSRTAEAPHEPGREPEDAGAFTDSSGAVPAPRQDARHARREGGASGAEDAFKSYLQDIRGLALLSREEEVVVARRAATGDPLALRQLVEANLRLTVAIARNYANCGVPMIDLIQEGNIGLMHAAEMFDWRRGTRFGTYAGWWIRQAISRAAREQSRMIHLPEHVAARLHKVRAVTARLTQDHGDEPSIARIADATGLPAEEVTDLLRLVEQPLSLDVTRAGDEHALQDTLEDPDAEVPADVAARHELGDGLRQALDHLAVREREVVRLRFGIEDGHARTLREVGRELRLSRERVRQIETSALARLRRLVGAAHRDDLMPLQAEREAG